MKKVWKWLAITVLILCVIGFAIYFKLYSDLKSTAEEMYTPLNDELPAKRTQVVDITKKEPFSALILGVDERDGDVGRSDTIIVLTVNPTLNSTKLISIPRDTYTKIIGKDFQDKINHAYAYGGIEMAMKTVENLLDIPIDYVAQVNMESFTDIVDIVGGITVNNTLEFNFEDEHFPIGELSLDGEKALKYVRMRYEDPEGDFGRQNRQKQVIQGVLKKSISFNTVLNYKTIFKTLEENIKINVMFDDLLNIRKHYGNSFNTIEQLYINNGVGTKTEGIYYYLPDEKELEEIQETLKNHLEI
ncbi:LCP family glycopolymer transferase [Solibacillus sp. FSL H8-0538]|uniref:LCP family glycopolymer transferase n=1 Tax=Solibacillus sp. FSL H8-0538 TaxID=2921400 RepID=UPI0030F9DE3B